MICNHKDVFLFQIIQRRGVSSRAAWLFWALICGSAWLDSMWLQVVGSAGSAICFLILRPRLRKQPYLEHAILSWQRKEQGTETPKVSKSFYLLMMCIISTHMPLAKVDLWVPSPMRKEQHREGLPFILTPMRRDSVRPLASLIHVPRRLRDLVADLLLDSSEKSKGLRADWSSLEQSEIHSLGSWYIPTKNISK